MKFSRFRFSGQACFDLVFSLFLSGFPACHLLAGTNVSNLPDLDYFTGMPRFVAAAGEILVVPELPEGSIYQLRKEQGLWTVVAEHAITDWLGYSRLHPPWVFRNGNDLLVMDASPVYEGFHVPKMTVVRKIDGLFTPQESVTLESKLLDPDIFGFSFLSITPLPDLLVMQSQVSYLGIGGVIKGFSFLKTGSGWVVGPDLPMATGYWWPIHSEVRDDVLHFWSLRLTSPYGSPPYDFVFTEQILSGESWTMVREQPFLYNGHLDILAETRSILSPDGTSLVLFPHHLEFLRDEPGWTVAGSVNNGQLDFTDLHLSSIGDGYALMRRGDVNFDPGGPVQHYHLLQFKDGAWRLQGDLPSHRRLDDYYYNDIFYALTDETVTIFDTSRYNRTAREYDSIQLDPIVSKWFPDSQTVGSGTEWLSSFGYFHPLYSEDGLGDWMWHWDLGWIYVVGRDSNSFYYWNPAIGWSCCNRQLFNCEEGRFWSYALNYGDFLWNYPDSFSPRLYYSYKLNEWISDTMVPSIDVFTSEQINSITEIFEQEGVSIEVDPVNQIAYFTLSQTVDGSLVTIRIEAPWTVTIGQPYACMVRLQIDLSWMRITVDGQSVYVNSSDLWTQEQILMPMILIIDFIFQTPDSGVSLETVEYNNGTRDPPVRAVFPEGG